MFQKSDLYTVLLAYAGKNNSPYINPESFFVFFTHYAQNNFDDTTAAFALLEDGAAKFWDEIAVFEQEGKCRLLTDQPKKRLYMLHYYPHRLQIAYHDPEKDEELPFHNENTLKLTIPEEELTTVNYNTGLFSYLAEAKAETAIIRITFPRQFPDALVVASMLPKRLTEIALIKVRSYLRLAHIYEHALFKMGSQFHDKELNIKTQFDQLLSHPTDCYASIEAGGNFSCFFWYSFYGIVMAEIERKTEIDRQDIAVVQALCIIQTICEYYKAVASKQVEEELAFTALETHLGKPPYMYDIEQICKFTNSKDVPLLSLYTSAKLEEWLLNHTTKAKENVLPPLLIFRGEGGKNRYVLKNKIPSLYASLITPARKEVKDALTEHWQKILLAFNKEAAMNEDHEFELLLSTFLRKSSPDIFALLRDQKFALVYSELEQDKGANILGRIFVKGHLIPLSSLLFLNRKETLREIKILLPLWYALPGIARLINFWKTLFGKKKRLSASGYKDTGKNEDTGQRESAKDTQASAVKSLASDLIPEGYTLQAYLEKLENDWVPLVDKRAREDLVKDVNALIKDNFRRKMRVQKSFVINQESINQMAQSIVNFHPTLATISGKSNLICYTELQLLKLISGKSDLT